MLNDVEEAIIQVLRESLKVVPGENINVKRPDFKKSPLPSISFENIDFKTEYLGIGASSGEKKEGVHDKFNGDGKTEKFKLSKKPLKPVLIVEHPLGAQKREIDDYFVDYEKGVINFRIIPENGKDNISVKYFINSSIGETKGMKFNLRYNLCVWAKDEAKRDEIAMEVLKTLVISADELNDEGIVLRAVGGANLNDEKIPEGVFGKSIECTVETEIYVEIPYERIKKIEIKEGKK
ncbi:MAG: hypothetical protein QMD06_00350 [Candidatus Altarchaeum sp.]|nr:hypothetical protein [Candidatus Altarchaeum sp.]